MPVLPAVVVTPTEFADALARLRRSIRRAVHVDLARPGLPASERELLILVHRSPGIGVAEAADALQVAPSTVSTLVGRLRRAALVRRQVDPSDRRAARLFLSAAGESRIAEIRGRRAAILDRAFDSLDPQERAILLGALPAIESLIVALNGQEAEFAG